MSGHNHDPAAVEAMIDHLSTVARRVADCGGDVAAVRAVIEDYSRLDAQTRRFDAESMPSNGPAGEWVVAGGGDTDRRLLYIHGGSWMSGSPDGYRPLAGRIAEATGCAVFLLDYRLAPENPFPAGLDDCVAAYRWMLANGPGGASSCARACIAGDSAGGNLTLATVLRLLAEDGKAPDAAIALSPAVDLTWQSPSMTSMAAADPILRPERLSLVSEAYVQGAAAMDDPLVSPVFGDLAGLARLLVQVGSREVLLDDARRIAEHARGQGVEVDLQIYPDMPHVFQLFAPTVPDAALAVDRIGAFVRAAVQG